MPLRVPAQPAQEPVLAAKYWILIDQATGQTLAANGPDQRIDPSGLARMMTVWLAFSALKDGRITENQPVSISQKAWRQTGTRMYIAPREPVTVIDLLRGIIVQSANDACVAIAELLAESEENFVTRMNAQAERLGMKNTHFTNANGRTQSGQYSTARDIAILASALVRDFPEYYSLFALKTFTYHRISQPNSNRLLHLDPTVDGMQTGYTADVGYSLVGSAQRGLRRLVSVVLGIPSENARAQESLKLLNYGFQSFDTIRLYSAEQPINNDGVRVWKGQDKQVSVGFTQDFILSIPSDKTNKITSILESRQPVLAPLTKGQVVGTLKIAVDGQPYGEYPVVALDNVPLAGFFSRLWDAIVLWFRSL